VRRVELELASGLVVEFVDRERALGQVEELLNLRMCRMSQPQLSSLFRLVL